MILIIIIMDHYAQKLSRFVLINIAIVRNEYCMC